MTLEQKAHQFAIESHNGQFRKDKITPYITHPKAVVELLEEINIKYEDIISSAWLHDTIEDCEVSSEQIREEFNPNIARIVSALTRDIDRDSYKERIKNSDYPIKIIKLADMVHNCSDLNSNPDLSKKTIDTKIKDCNEFYFDLAKEICPKFYTLLRKYIEELDK